MSNLREYLNTLPVPEQGVFAVRCGTTLGYLRKAISVRQRLNAEVCINIERESKGEIKCEVLRPDVDWSYIRVSGYLELQKKAQAPANAADAATETVAEQGA